MLSLIHAAGGLDLFNHLATTILSQPAAKNEVGTVFDSNAELDEWLAPEQVTLDEFLHTPAESIDCMNEALLQRPYRLVWNADHTRWSRLKRSRLDESPDVWTQYSSNEFWADGGFEFEYRFRCLFRTIHGRNLGSLTLTPAGLAAWNQEKATYYQHLHALQHQAIAVTIAVNGGVHETKEDH